MEPLLDRPDGASRRQPMEAYMIDIDLANATEAQVDRDSAEYDPFGSWSLQTGGGAKVPDEWLQHWPARAHANAKYGHPTAWINAAGYCVSPMVKSVIEELAPNVHQFIPLLLLAGPASDRRTYDYFSVHVADRADDVMVEKSDVNWREMNGAHYWTKKFSSPIVLPRDSIWGKHLWWNRKANILLCSGQLHDRLVAADLSSGLTFQKQIVE
jgi:hypothetical protein